MKNYFSYWPVAVISQCMKVIVFVFVTINVNLFLEKYTTTTLLDKISQ